MRTHPFLPLLALLFPALLLASDPASATGAPASGQPVNLSPYPGAGIEPGGYVPDPRALPEMSADRLTQLPPNLPAEMLNRLDPRTTQSTAPLSPALRARAGSPVGRDAWILPVREGQDVFVHLIITGGHEEDRLVRASTGWAERAILYFTHIEAKEAEPQHNTKPVEKIRFPAGAEAVFNTTAEPGLSLLLKNMRRSLREQQVFPLTLHFEKAGPIRVMVSVRPAP